MGQQVKVYRELQFYLGGAKKVEFSINSSGNVEIKDASGNIIGTLNAANRKLIIPSGAVIDASAATGSISLAAGEIDTADLASNAVTTVKITDANVTTAKIADANVTTAKIADNNVTQVKIAAASLDGTIAKVVADSNVIGGVPVLHRIAVPGTGKAAIDVTLTHKERVVDAWIVLTGAGVTGGTVTVGNAANAITDAMAATGSDTAIVRAGTIDDAYHEIAAAGTLRITPAATGADATPCIVYVLAVRVA